MLESVIVEKICSVLWLRFGLRMHKYHGGTFSENGVADLFGTLPPTGRAVYLEVKTPEAYKSKPSARRRLQEAWLAREASAGAITGLVCSAQQAVEVVDKALSCSDSSS